MRIAIAAIVLLMLAGAAFADVNNVSLNSVGNSGISGTATTITGQFGGVTPHTHVEVNARLNQMPASGMIYEAWLIDNQSNTKQSLGVLEGNMLNSDMLVASFSDSGPWDSIAISMESISDSNPAPGRIVAQGNLPGNDVSEDDFARAAVLPQDEMFQQQLVMQRYNLTSSQIMDLRMQGLTYREINFVGNVASRCNQSPTQVARAYMDSGGDIAALATSCNTTVAQLLTPTPFVAVAGTRQEIVPGTAYVVPNYYLLRENGARVLTYSQWQRFRQAGYSWEEVAVAANISQRTGVPVGDILLQTRVQGLTFDQIALNYNIQPTDIDDVSAWPWERNGEGTIIVTPQGTLTTTSPTVVVPAPGTNVPQQSNVPSY